MTPFKTVPCPNAHGQSAKKGSSLASTRRLSEGYPMSALHEERQLSTEQRRALKFLADAGQRGCTGATLLGHGFSIGMLDDLVWLGKEEADKAKQRSTGHRLGSRVRGLCRLLLSL